MTQLRLVDDYVCIEKSAAKTVNVWTQT